MSFQNGLNEGLQEVFRQLSSPLVDFIIAQIGECREVENCSDSLVKAMIADHNRELRTFRLLQPRGGWFVGVQLEGLQSSSVSLVSQNGHLLSYAEVRSVAELEERMGTSFTAYCRLIDSQPNTWGKGELIADLPGLGLVGRVDYRFQEMGLTNIDCFLARCGSYAVIEGCKTPRKVVVRIVAPPGGNLTPQRAMSIATYMGEGRRPYSHPFSGLRPIAVKGPILDWETFDSALEQIT